MECCWSVSREGDAAGWCLGKEILPWLYHGSRFQWIMCMPAAEARMELICMAHHVMLLGGPAAAVDCRCQGRSMMVGWLGFLLLIGKMLLKSDTARSEPWKGDTAVRQRRCCRRASTGCDTDGEDRDNAAAIEWDLPDFTAGLFNLIHHCWALAIHDQMVWIAVIKEIPGEDEEIPSMGRMVLPELDK
ncbi:hypothetical protein ACLOJK_038900 [Asimina triloba]